MAKKKAKAKVIETTEDKIAKANQLINTGKLLNDIDMVVLGITALQQLNALPENFSVQPNVEASASNGQYNDEKGVFISQRKQIKGDQFSDNQRICRNEPINLKGKINRFTPPPANQAEQKEIDMDKRLTDGLVRSERRDAIRYIKLTCEWCGRQFEQHPEIAASTAGGGGGRVCNRCLSGAKQ